MSIDDVSKVIRDLGFPVVIALVLLFGINKFIGKMLDDVQTTLLGGQQALEQLKATHAAIRELQMAAVTSVENTSVEIAKTNVEIKKLTTEVERLVGLQTARNDLMLEHIKLASEGLITTKEHLAVLRAMNYIRQQGAPRGFP
ncbi:MAG: hypothetical protein ACR2QC_01595 [Gammaproteobacteria bacterium]